MECRRAISIAFALAVSAAGCEYVHCTLAYSFIDLTVIEPYDMSSQFRYEPYVSDGPPCTGLPDPGTTLRFITGKNLGGAARLSCLMSAQVEGAPGSIVWHPIDEAPGTSGSTPEDVATEQAIYSSWIFAQGTLTLPDGCTGTYTFTLTPYNVSATGADAYLQTPVPGQWPPWILDRMFQPQSGCASSGLPARCADTWAAYATAIAVR